MLIRFQVSNFLSFRDEIEFSMIPGLTRQHSHHVLRGEGRNDLNILRAAVIYGPNASGKSNLIKSLSFAKNFIIEGRKPKQLIPVKPFKLDKVCANQPSKFAFEIKHNQRCFIYGFEIDEKRVISEWLYEIKKTTESLLFYRKHQGGNPKIEFGKIKYSGIKERDFLEFVAMGTRPNQLFLTESVERGAKYFEDVYDWFKEVLVIIFPESLYMPLGIHIKSKDKHASLLVDYLQKFDTGVCGFGFSEIIPENEIPVDVWERIKNEVDSGTKVSIIGPDNQRFIITKDNSHTHKAFKLMFKHKMSTCEEEVNFDMIEESDGTLRLIDLIPILYDLGKGNHVFVIDELDRSLHSALSYQIIDLFLKNTEATSQIIVTTHDTHLLTFDLLRRDEIWFFEKNIQGYSQMYSLEEFAPRYDNDIQHGYIKGRFGAIPVVGRVNKN